jgi:hypothetical protein
MQLATRPAQRPAFSVTAQIVEEAARLHGLEGWQLMRRNRMRQFSHTRFGVIWVLRHLGLTWATIRDQLGFEDHKSVMYGHAKAVAMRRDNPEFLDYTTSLLAFALTREPLVKAEAA